MTRRGFSSANGSGRMPLRGLKSAGASMPPVYSGIVPSLLPALSAPTSVSVVPSCVASSKDTELHALGAASDASAAKMTVLRNIELLLVRCPLLTLHSVGPKGLALDNLGQGVDLSGQGRTRQSSDGIGLRHESPKGVRELRPVVIRPGLPSDV